jgi:hypothetical protein
MHAMENAAENADGGFNVGERLLLVRRQRGLSERALAMRAEVTHRSCR